MTDKQRLQRYLEWYVVDANGCWLWQGKVDSNGYASAHVRPRNVRVHRFVYEQIVGPVTEGHVLHHTCETKTCINPGHLEEVTRADHLTLHPRQVSLLTHCRRGHDFTPDNTHIDSQGRRWCRACGRIRANKLWAEGRYSRQRVNRA